MAENGSFSAAAQRLYISKVSVMNQINTLEKRLGVSLFERTTQGVILTEAGAVFLKHSKKLVRLADKAIEETQKAGGLAHRTICVGISMMRPASLLMETWEKLVEKPDMQIDMISFSDGPDGLAQMLKALGNTIDCFVSPCGSTQMLMSYNFLPLAKCQVCVALSRRHPLAKKEILRWEDLEDNSLLLLKRGDSYVLDELRDDILNHHPTVNIVDADSYYDISAFNLCEKQGYMMETLDIWKDLHPSLVTLPVDWPYEMPLGVMYAREPAPTVKLFIDSLQTGLSK